MSRALRFLLLGLVGALAASCGSGSSSPSSGTRTILNGGWVRFHSPLGWSLSYPKSLYFRSVGPSVPEMGPPSGPLTTVTVASFRSLARGGRGTYGIPVDRSHVFPQDALAVQIQGGQWSQLLQTPDARFPLSFSEFRRGAWPLRRLANGAPWPLEHTVDAGGERYFIQVWLGRDAPARLRTVLVRMIGSIKFDPLRAGTTHGAVAVVQKASHYPDGSFTLLHIGGQVCAGGVETCQNASEPIYLIHAPGHFDLSNLPLDARCVPASSCLPFGSFYAIGWRDKTGYPSACDLRLDRRDEQFYCTNTRARWDLGGRPITIPNSGHDYPTALSFDVAKIAWDGRIIIGGSYTSEIPSSVVKALWPRLPPPR